jgi:tRNA threonylcarbamoyladenosine biosynthesis protein TsaE
MLRMSEPVTTKNAAETEVLGAQLARELRPGDVVLVQGELGAGKTTFVRGAAQALGVRTPVTSPTFTIGHRYRAPIPVAHVDLFRLGSLDAEDPGLLDDYLGPDTITFVEWPEVAAAELNGLVARRVRIEHGGGDVRVVDIG